MAAAAAAAKAASIVEQVDSPAAVPIPTQQPSPAVTAATPVVIGEKRPAEAPLSQAPSMKQKRVAWVESQVKKDQNEAVTPNYRVPFRSKEDSCKRLLRYHVFHELDESPKETMQEEDAYEARASALLAKTRSMIDKYHYLMVQESMVRISYLIILTFLSKIHLLI